MSEMFFSLAGDCDWKADFAEIKRPVFLTLGVLFASLGAICRMFGVFPRRIFGVLPWRTFGVLDWTDTIGS